MKSDNFCTELPQGYVQVFCIDAKKGRTAVAMNVVGLVMALAVILPCLLCVNIRERFSADYIVLIVFVVCLLVYFVAHELVHGIAYKVLTGRKLVFGLTLSVAFCGVPDIYVTRRTALIALIAPFAVFSVLFSALAAWLYFFNAAYYAVTVTILGLHFGGCVGDLYTFILLCVKLKDKKLLMRDTGPRQEFYVPAGN